MRTIAIIKAQIIAEKNAHAELSGLTSTSQTAIWNLWAYVIAAVIYLHEVIVEALKTEIEASISSGAIGTPSWMKDRTLKFQYDAVTPQLLTVKSDFSIDYPTNDTTKRIVTRCAVIVDNNKTVNIKVAKLEPPAQLTTVEKTALVGYWNMLGNAGVTINIVNEVSDKLYLGGTIYYNGLYSTVIKTNAEAAINAYLANLPFNGVIKISAIEDAIQAVVGVSDVALINIALRADFDTIANTTYMVQSGLFVRKSVTPLSGYAIGETTTGYTFATALTYTVE